MSIEQIKNFVGFVLGMAAMIAANFNVPVAHAMIVKNDEPWFGSTVKVVGRVEVTVPEDESDQEEQVEDDVELKKTPYASINGKTLDPDLQDLLFEELQKRDIEWYFDIALCQLYQESTFIPTIVSPDGRDCGIAQIRVEYLSEFMKIAGMTSCDVFNPTDAIVLYVGLVARNVRITDSVDAAISTYMTGSKNVFSQSYVDQVKRWLDTVERINPEPETDSPNRQSFIKIENKGEKVK